MKPAHHTRRLTAGYPAEHPPKAVITNADLQLYPGEVTCLLGANGAGKSTLLRTISGLQPPVEGEIFIGDRPVGTIPQREMARLISVVYTERTHAGALTVEETAALGRQPYTGFFGRLSQDDRHIVARALEAVGIAPLADRFLATLSDGERQKVMIARALAQQTPVMLLDEPTSFLDVASRLEVMALLSALASRQQKAVLLSTHDVANALAIASRLWLILPGGEMECGTPSELIEKGLMDRLFAGRDIHFDRNALDYRLSPQTDA